MNNREKYIEVLSKTVKTVKEFNEDTPIKISLECVEDILELLKEQEDLGTELTNAVELIHKKNERIEKLLKEQETANLYKCPNCGTWVSAENVVRCKDCKHGGCRTQNMDGSIFRVVCKKYSTKRNERWMDADWFCADGERQEGR